MKIEEGTPMTHSENTQTIDPRAAPYIVVSGLPASGKTTLARNLAAELEVLLIDKDDILERFFDSMGSGDSKWRQLLSRTSDVAMQHLAPNSGGAILTSFWHQQGMSASSGTPTDWIPSDQHLVIEIYCDCPPEVAARRFVKRERHSGHLDNKKRESEVLADFRDLSSLGPLHIGELVRVDTSGDVDHHAVADKIRSLMDH